MGDRTNLLHNWKVIDEQRQRERQKLEEVLRVASRERENNYVYSDEKSAFKVTEYSQGLSKYYSNSLASTQKPTIPHESDKSTTGPRQ